MLRVAYDETHEEKWTISYDQASLLAPACPERHSYEHLAWLSNITIGTQSVRLTSPWDANSLKSADVLVLAEPLANSNARGRAAALTDDEVRMLIAFVEEGGAILIVTSDSVGALAGINQLTSPFGVTVTSRQIVTTRPEGAYLLDRRAECDDIDAHESTDGVSRVTIQFGVALDVAAPARSVIRTPNGETVFAVCHRGSGRLAVISGAQFAAPFIGQADNGVMFLSALNWLTGSKRTSPWHADREKVAELLAKTYSPIQVEAISSARTAGDGGLPAIDVSGYATELSELYNDSLDPYRDRDEFMMAAELAFHRLPEHIRREVVIFRQVSNRHGALLIKGLPGDPSLPDTPADPYSKPYRTTHFSEFWLAVFGSGLGDLMAYHQEKAGSLFQNVIPTAINANNLSSESSESPLDFHTEAAFHPNMPDYLLLYCARPNPDRDAATSVGGVRMMIPQVPLKYRPVLREPVFKTGIDFSFGSQDRQAGNGPMMSILSGDPFDPLMKLDPDLMVGMGPDARTALKLMTEAARICEVSVVLDSTDLIMIDNHHAVHARSVFRAYYNGQDRWLQRTYVLRDLAHTREDRQESGRVIRTTFAT